MGRGRDPLFACLISDLSELRDGDLASAESLKDVLAVCGLELRSRAIGGSAKVSWVLDILHDYYLLPGFLSTLDSKLRLVNAAQTSLNDWLGSGRRTPMNSFCCSCWDGWRECSLQEPIEDSIPSYAVVVSAVVLLALVYQYLTGNVDRGGSKAYSRSSLDFRDIYVAIVLFLGAYVWIKFREAAFRGVHPRELPDKQGGIKVVYEARLKPPMWDGEKVPRLDLGRFATPQEAHNKFLIAAFYYNRAAGLLDGWFQVPPMSEEERRRIRTGLDLRAWVLGQAKKVYEDFKKGAEAEEEAALVQDLYEVCEGQATEERDEGNVNPYGASLLNSAEHQQPVLVSQVENSGMGMAMLDNHRLECASHSFDGMHEGLALSDGHSLGTLEGSAPPVSQLPPNTESGISLNGSDQLDLLQTLACTQQQQISFLQQQISDQQRQNQDFGAQILQFRNQQRIQQQQLQESRIQNPQWPCQFCLQQQQLQVINQGVPGFQVEMEQSMQEHNYSGLMASPPDGWEFQEGFSELDTLTYMSNEFWLSQ